MLSSLLVDLEKQFWLANRQKTKTISRTSASFHRFLLDPPQKKVSIIGTWEAFSNPVPK